MDDRRDGHLLTLCASLHVRIIQHGSTDQSYPSRATTVIVMRGTHIYTESAYCFTGRDNVYKRIDRPVPCPRSAFCIFHFRGTGGAPEALQNAISGLGCWSDFSLRTRNEGGRMPGVQCVFGSTSIGRRVSTKGKESLVSVTQNGFRVINATNRAQSSRMVTR